MVRPDYPSQSAFPAVPGLPPLGALRTRGGGARLPRVDPRAVAVRPARRPPGAQRHRGAQRGRRARSGGLGPGARPTGRRGRRVAAGHRERDVRPGRHRHRPLPDPRRDRRRGRRRTAGDRRRHRPARRPGLAGHREPRDHRRRRTGPARGPGRGHGLRPARRDGRQRGGGGPLHPGDLQRGDRARPGPSGVRRLRRARVGDPRPGRAADPRGAAGPRGGPALLLRPAVVVLRAAGRLRLLLPRVRRVARPPGTAPARTAGARPRSEGPEHAAVDREHHTGQE